MPGKLAPNVVAVSEKARALTHGVVGDHTHSVNIFSTSDSLKLLASSNQLNDFFLCNLINVNTRLDKPHRLAKSFSLLVKIAF